MTNPNNYSMEKDVFDKLRRLKESEHFEETGFREPFEDAFSNKDDLTTDEFSFYSDPKKEQKSEARKYIRSYRKLDVRENRELYDQLLVEIELAIDNETFVWDENHRVTLRAFLKGNSTYKPIYVFIYAEELARERTERIDTRKRLDEFSSLNTSDLQKTVFQDLIPDQYDELRVETVEDIIKRYSFDELLNKPAVNDAAMQNYIDGLIMAFLVAEKHTLEEYIAMKPRLRSPANQTYVLSQIELMVSVLPYDTIVAQKSGITDPEILAVYSKYEQIKYRKYKPEDFETKAPVYDLAVLENKADITYDEFRYAYFAITDVGKKKTVLKNAISAAQKRADDLRKNQDKEPAAGIYQHYHDLASLSATLGSNHIPASNDQISIIYNSIAEGNPAEPWILLALWMKEGSGEIYREFSAPLISTPNAKANARSYVYYMKLGIDHFISYSASRGSDNSASFYSETDGTEHEKVFTANINAEKNKGTLPKNRNIAKEINDEIKISTSGGDYKAEFSNRFYSLSLMLAGAFYTSVKSDFYADASARPELKGKVPDNLTEAINEATEKGDTDNLNRYNAVKENHENTLDLGWEYVYWNGGPGVYQDLIVSAGKHARDKSVVSQYGNISASDFAFETKPKANEYDQVRENAIRFKYYVSIYQLVFNGWPQE